MQFNKLFDDDRAVSPVIGVILMVAITVILAAVIGTFVLGLGNQVQETSPNANIAFDYTNDSDGDDTLQITHETGDTIEASQVSVVVSGAENGGPDANAKYAWNDFTDSDVEEINAGSSVTLTQSNLDSDSDPGNLNLAGASARVTWASDSGGSSATLGEWSGPEA